MYTTTQRDNGVLNNYATEPEMTYAEYPGLYEQRRYLKQGAIALRPKGLLKDTASHIASRRAPAKLIAALFVSALVLISFVVS